jgi:hypothetical protein
MPSKSKPSKKTLIATARRAYQKLTRAYHAAGKRAIGKPKTSRVHREYVAARRARTAAGTKLGKLTGVHKR